MKLGTIPGTDSSSGGTGQIWAPQFPPLPPREEGHTAGGHSRTVEQEPVASQHTQAQQHPRGGCRCLRLLLQLVLAGKDVDRGVSKGWVQAEGL